MYLFLYFDVKYWSFVVAKIINKIKESVENGEFSYISTQFSYTYYSFWAKDFCGLSKTDYNFMLVTATLVIIVGQSGITCMGMSTW